MKKLIAAMAIVPMIALGAPTASAHFPEKMDQIIEDLKVVEEQCVQCCTAWELPHNSGLLANPDICNELCKEFAVNMLKASVGIEEIIARFLSW